MDDETMPSEVAFITAIVHRALTLGFDLAVDMKTDYCSHEAMIWLRSLLPSVKPRSPG